MKNAVFIMFFTFLFVNVFYAQSDRKYQAVEFEDFQYQWLHPVIDSALTGRVMKVNAQKDTIFYDGFSSFYGTELYRVDPVIYNDKVFIVEQLWKGWSPIGSFVQCLDLKTGVVQWQTRFYYEDNRKELSRYAFINEDGQLEILGMKENKSGNCNNCYHLIVRTYDIETGALLKKVAVNESNQQALDIYGIPLFPGQSNFNNFLFPYSQDQYIYFQLLKDILAFRLDDSCQVVQNDTIKVQSDYDHRFYGAMYRTPSGNFLFFQSGQDSINYPVDSLYFNYHYFDKDYNIISEGELRGIISPTMFPYYINVYSDDDYFVLRGIDSVFSQKDSFYYNMAIYNMFDMDGNLVEQVSITDAEGYPFKYGENNNIFGKATKLKYDDGMLILFLSEDENDNRFLNFIKTDGYSNYKHRKQIKLKGKNHVLSIIRSIQLENGDFLISFLDDNSDLDESGYNSFATIYMLFSADDLKVKTNIIEKYIEKHSIEIFPNPADDMIVINSGSTKFNKIVAYNIFGKQVYVKNNHLTNELKFDISVLKSGIYIVKIFKNNEEIGISKFVKGN